MVCFASKNGATIQNQHTGKVILVLGLTKSKKNLVDRATPGPGHPLCHQSCLKVYFYSSCGPAYFFVLDDQ